jgi:hypothetical protein
MPLPEYRPLSCERPLKQSRRVYAEQLQDVSDDIFCCPICTHVLLNPVLSPEGALVCGACLSVQPLEHLRGSKRLFLALLKKRPVRCLFHPQVRAIAPASLLGHDVERTDTICEWVGPLEDYDAHVAKECKPCRELCDAW